MTLIEVLRIINIGLSLLTSVILFLLLLRSVKDIIFDGSTSNLRSTGVMIILINAALFFNSVVLSGILAMVMAGVDRGIINYASNIRVLVFNVVILFVAWLVHQIRKSKI